MMSLKSPDADVGVNGITWPKESYCISFWSSWPNRQNCVIDDSASIMWHWHQHEWNHMTKQIMLHIVSVFLTLQINWYYWQCYCHHMLLVSTGSNDWKCHVASHFDYLEQQWNTGFDDTISVMWCKHWYHKTKCHITPYFNHLNVTKMVPLTVPSVACAVHAGANSVTWPKESYHTLFQLSSPNKQNGGIDDAVNITCQECWYQWHHMTEKIMFHLTLTIVTWWMQLCHWEDQWHHKNMLRHCFDISRHWLDMIRYIKTYLVIV